MQVRFAVDGRDDFTGSRIISDKATFVQSGAAKTKVAGMKIADHITETLPPIDSLGNRYVVVPFANRTNGDLIKIIGMIPDLTPFRYLQYI